MTIKPNPRWRGDPTFLPEVLKAFGLEVEMLDGWDNRGHGDFDVIQGIIVHHIGSNKYDAWNIARHPTLGLCSQIHLARNGKVTLCGVGVAYHAGKGWFSGWPTNNANWTSIGVEAESDGVTPWPDVQMDAYHRLCAAILWFLGKRATTKTLLSHWEYSNKAQGKWDPGAGIGRAPRNGDDKAAMLNMEVFRSKVNHYIDNPPNAAKTIIKEHNGVFDQVFSSRVQGSSFKGKLIDFILNGDAHAFVSRANTELIKKKQEALEEAVESVRKDINQILAEIRKK